MRCKFPAHCTYTSGLWCIVYKSFSELLSECSDLTRWHTAPCRYATQQSQPPLDSSQDILATSAVHENGVTTVGFQRQRVTGDPNDVPLNQCVYFLYAWGGMFSSTTELLQYHGSTRRGTVGTTMICLPTAQECAGVYS